MPNATCELGTSRTFRLLGLTPHHFAPSLLLLMAGIMIEPGLPAIAQDAIRLKPGQDVAALVSAQPPGTQFIFSAGTYRMQSIVPKANDVFIGEGTAVLDGAKVLEMEPDGGNWFAVAAPLTGDKSRCAQGHPLCWILSDLFIDDQLQTPVESLSELRPGRWFYDGGLGRVYISTNPASHKVEFGVAQAAFYGTATGVQIRSLTVEKYASPPQHGALGGQNGKALGWTVLDTEVRWNHGAGIAVGPNSHVERCHIHDNGQLGLTGHGNDIVVLGNEIAYNNYAGYRLDWEAGGAKVSGSDHLVVRSNYVHDNFGSGLWTDIDNIHTLYEGNRVINNQNVGIHHEISYDAVIRKNIVKGNKVGILIVLSPNVEVYGNTVEVPPNGIEGIRVATGRRGGGAYGAYVAHDDYVHDNIISCLGPNGRSGASGPLVEGANIRFDSDEYHFVGGGTGHFIWGTDPMTLSDLHHIGIEQNATVKKGPVPEIDPTH
jgi:hypothetical protein